MDSPTKNGDGKGGRRPKSTRTKRDPVDVRDHADETKVDVTTRLQLAKVDQHGKTAKDKQLLVEDASFDEDSVELGAVQVRGVLGGHLSPPMTDYAVEAHVVDESSPGLHEQEKQELERQTRERLLRELESAAVHADVLVEKERSCSRFACVFIIVLVLIASVTAAVLVFGPSSKEGGSSSKSLTTVSSNPSQQPSLVPTFAPRNNTYCDEAHDLSIGLEVNGTFAGAIDAMAINCAQDFLYPSPGLWYLYRGQGFPVVVRSDEAVDINVYINCDSVCNQGNYYLDNGRGVQWEADVDVDYFVLVSKKISGETISDKFTFKMETNDSIENAFGPLIPGTDTIVAGSTVGARMASDVPACGSASAPSGPGVWYSIVGNGKTITLSTCDSPTSLDTQISVFSNGSICENGNDDYCASKSQVALSSNVDELYYVLVHGKTGSEGTFVLQLTTEGESLANADFCANAQVLDVGSNTTIDLLRATVDPDQADCTASTYPGEKVFIGNFYRFTGTGQAVRIVMDSTSWSDLSGVTLLSVFTGSSCGSLECLDPGCGYDCEVFTTLGQDYYVYASYIEDIGPPEGILTLQLLDL